jgi:Secretion system C-terminal sorting domain
MIRKNNYCITALFFLFTTLTNLQAQIIYTDIVPDYTPNVQYHLDLNNDTIDDFVFMAGVNVINCYALNNNSYAGQFASGKNLAWAKMASDSICPGLQTWFDSSKLGTLAVDTTIGYWIAQSDKYIALQLVVGTNAYYGWARLDVFGNSNSFTIKDYAYNNSPNNCITAGNTALHVNQQHQTPIISIQTNPNTQQVTLQSDKTLKNAICTIFNIYGQKVAEINNISGNTFLLPTTNCRNGLYCIQLYQNNKVLFSNQFYSLK